MKRLIILISILSVFLLAGNAGADLLVMGPDEYETPEGWTNIANRSLSGFSDRFYFEWGFNDVGSDSINITFHNIYNENADPNWLNVYIKDEGTIGFYFHGDQADPSIPEWSGLGYSLIGVWTDLDGPVTKNDILFSMSNLPILSNCNSFVIGIDPDCNFYFDELTIDALLVTAVPEPTTMFLFGSGLISLGALGRKKFLRKG